MRYHSHSTYHDLWNGSLPLPLVCATLGILSAPRLNLSRSTRAGKESRQQKKSNPSSTKLLKLTSAKKNWTHRFFNFLEFFGANVFAICCKKIFQTWCRCRCCCLRGSRTFPGYKINPKIRQKKIKRFRFRNVFFDFSDFRAKPRLQWNVKRRLVSPTPTSQLRF